MVSKKKEANFHFHMFKIKSFNTHPSSIYQAAIISEKSTVFTLSYKKLKLQNLTWDSNPVRMRRRRLSNEYETKGKKDTKFDLAAQ